MGRERKGKAVAPRDGLKALGTDGLCDAILEGQSLTEIAAGAGASKASLLAWIEVDPDRSVRARDSRARTARVWDEKAEDEIRRAKDAFELAKAKELAHHYRWRASKIAPKDYGDKVEHSGPDGGGIPVSLGIRFVTPEDKG